MPKKGKGKKKGKGDKKAAAGPPPPTVQEEEPLDELSKQFYLIQITDLERRLARYQTKSDKLQVDNDELQKQLRQQLEDQEERVTFLKKKSSEQAECYNDLEEKLAAVQQAKNSEKERYEQQLSQLKEDSQRLLDQAAVENKVLQGQLESLEKFRVNKEKLEAEMNRKEEQIDQMGKEHTDALYKLEKKAVLDKHRMKKDMETKVNNAASEFRKVSDLQMAMTTKRTIRENVAINSQLLKMSEKTTELIRQNDQLKARERDLARHVEILEFNEKEITRRNISTQKVMKLMRDSASEQSTKTSMLQDRVTKCALMEAEASQAHEEALAHKRESEFYKARLSSVEEELGEMRSKLDNTTSELAKVSSVLGKASLAIQASLQPDSEHPVQRENLLATLLQLLNFHPSESSQQKTQLPLNSHHSLRMPSYHPGDLGIVPVAKSKTVSLTDNEGTSPQLPPINPRTSLTAFQQTVVQ